MDRMHRSRGALLGLACGDAVGTTVEFAPRGSFTPVTDMVGGGPFRLPVGAWTDDTSMALCLATSLIECQGFDARDQMERYCRWRDHGYLSSTGRCFDIGITISGSLRRFAHTGEPFSGLDNGSSGNGCIMRLAPIPLYYYPHCETTLDRAADSARTTHGTRECIEASQLLASMLLAALSGASKETILFGTPPEMFSEPRVRAIASGTYREKPMSAISGSGYVIHCLEAAAWAFWRTDSFRAAILEAVNLGDDADTTGAVCGQIAGAFYGEPGIPAEWLQRLVMVDDIRQLADRLAAGAIPA